MSDDMLGGIAISEVKGPFEDLNAKLCGSDGRLWLSALKCFLRKENPWPSFPTWRTVKLGVRKTVEDLTGALEQGGFRIGDWARQMLGKVKLAAEPFEIELVVVTGSDVGLQGNYTTAQMYAAAEARHLSPCPAEVGPALREQYADQPMGEWLIIAMEPIADSDGDLVVFLVEHDGGGRWLNGRSGHPDDQWYADYRWVFSHSKL